MLLETHIVYMSRSGKLFTGLRRKVFWTGASAGELALRSRSAVPFFEQGAGRSPAPFKYSKAVSKVLLARRLLLKVARGAVSKDPDIRSAGADWPPERSFGLPNERLSQKTLGGWRRQ